MMGPAASRKAEALVKSSGKDEARKMGDPYESRKKDLKKKVTPVFC